jgi:plasmid stabilization system protein ParE
MVEGRDWYEGQREGMGSDFLAAVDEVFDRIREAPELYAAEYKSVRRVGLSHFPFVVYYRIVGDAVEVIAVQHGSRKPRSWRSRA